MHSLAPPAPVLRYEEEEEDSDEEDVYAPELPPDLAAARANANPTSSVPPAARRPIGPARGPLQREEEEEESEDEIGPAPPGPSSSSHVHEDAVIDFMQKEAQRRQAIEVRFSSPPSGFPVLVPLCACASLVQCVQHVHAYKRVRQCYLPMPLLQDAARPKTLQREEWMLVPPSSSDLLSSALLFPSSPRPSPPTFIFPDIFSSL